MTTELINIDIHYSTEKVISLAQYCVFGERPAMSQTCCGALLKNVYQLGHC